MPAERFIGLAGAEILGVHIQRQRLARFFPRDFQKAPADAACLVAMSHAICRDLVHKKGGTNVHPPIKNRLGQKVPLGHKWHRQTRREWWPNQ